jgi:hypothetical protein
MLRVYREQDKPRLERMAASSTNCTKIVSDKTHLYLFIAFMLVTTTIYMAWNIHHVNMLRNDVQQIVNEKDEAKRKADYFFQSVQNRSKQ